MKQKVFIIWASWNVWRELINQILENDWIWEHINPTEIVWVSNSSYFIFEPNSISKDILKSISSSRESAIKEFSARWTKIDNLLDLVDIVKESWMNWEVVFTDVTNWKKELLDFHKKVIKESSNFLVTANKNPISLFSMKDFIELTTYTWRYDTNTTVMWGWWILNFVDERTKIKDDLKSIEWVFSGTLWYILSELEKWEKNFSQIVRDAKEQGYTEPNPWDDLNWLDVARKLIILARYAFYHVNISDVIIEPLIDEKYSKYSWEDFLKALEQEDEFFEKKSKEAKERWMVLRYVWTIKNTNWKIDLRVWLKEFPINSDLWSLSGTSNLVIVESKILENPLPHVIKSRWAGLWVTAWSVRVWISKMLPQNLPQHIL